jgi:hypothetical protein
MRVTSSRTKLHLAATRALAAREDVRSFGLTLPSPTTDLELQELMTWTWPRLTSLDIQQARFSQSSVVMIMWRFIRYRVLCLTNLMRDLLSSGTWLAGLISLDGQPFRSETFVFFMHAAAAPPADGNPVRIQGHELSPGSLRCLARASRLEALSVDGISVVGNEGWSALGQLTHLTSLAVRSRGDNTGLNHVHSPPPQCMVPTGNHPRDLPLQPAVLWFQLLPVYAL